MHVLATVSDAEAATAAAVLGLVVILVSMAITFAIGIVICLILYGCQERVPMEHRKIGAGQIWLLLIPLFSLVWNFFVFLRMPDSYKSYFDAQGRHDVGDCGRGIGLWFAICAAVSLVPCVQYVAAPAALVLLILFLVKMTSLKKELPELAA